MLSIHPCVHRQFMQAKKELNENEEESLLLHSWSFHLNWHFILYFYYNSFNFSPSFQCSFFANNFEALNIIQMHTMLP